MKSRDMRQELFFTFMQIRRCVNEILELCFSFSELIQGLRRDNFVFSSEGQQTFQHISMVSLLIQ